MKHIFISFISTLLCSIGLHAQTLPNQSWLQKYSSSDSIRILPSAIDAYGNVYVGGYALTANKGYDYSLVKYSSSGVVLWAQAYNGAYNGNDKITAIAVDALGNVFVTGSSATSPTSSDYVTILYDKDGNRLWVSAYNGTGSGMDIPTAIAPDNTGNVYVTGGSDGPATGTDYATLKYNSHGNQQWVNRYNGSANQTDAASGVVATTAGIFVTGISASITGTYDALTQRLDPATGTELWAASFDGSFHGVDAGTCITADVLGNIYVGGETQIAADNTDYLIIKYSAAGAQSWVRTHDGYGLFDGATALVTDNNNNLVVTGACQSAQGTETEYHTIKYNGNGQQLWLKKFDVGASLTNNPVRNTIALGRSNSTEMCGNHWNGQTFDFLLVHYTADGTEQWYQYYHSPANENALASSLVVDSAGALYVTGQTYTGTAYQSTTIKYAEKEILIPPDTLGGNRTRSLSFLPNLGQLVDFNEQLVPDIGYYARGALPRSPDLFFKNNSLSYVLNHSDTVAATMDTVCRVDMAYVNPQPSSLGAFERAETGYYNYFLGHCPQGIVNVYPSQRLVLPALWKGIDLHYSSGPAGLVYSLVVSPDAGTNQIHFSFAGMKGLRVDPADHSLHIQTDLGDIVQKQPIAYQLNPSGAIQPLAFKPEFVVSGNDVSFKLGGYDARYTLVLQVATQRELPRVGTAPVGLIYSTYLGGTMDDYLYDETFDDFGEVFVAGATWSTNFPVSKGVLYTQNQGYWDGVVACFSGSMPTNTFNYATYIGGRFEDRIQTLSYNRSNRRLDLVGFSTSGNFPTKNAHNSGYFSSSLNNGSGGENHYFDITFSVIGFAGNKMDFSTFYGGSSNEQPTNMTEQVNPITGNWTTGIVGWTCSTDFPLFKNDMEGTVTIPNTASVGIFMEATNNLNRIRVGCFGDNTGNFGTKGYGIVMDNSGNWLITGTGDGNAALVPGIPTAPTYTEPNHGLRDVVLVKIPEKGPAISWFTYLGGKYEDMANGMAYDAVNNIIYITGGTQSPNFPTFPDVENLSAQSDAIIAAFSAQTGERLWCHQFGGSTPSYGSDIQAGFDILVAASGIVFVVGRTPCSDFPTLCTPNSYCQNSVSTKLSLSGFIAAFKPDHSMLYSTYFGGADYTNPSRMKIQTSTGGNDLFLVGNTYGIPVTPLTCVQKSWAGCYDGFLSDISIANVLLAGIDDPVDQNSGLIPFPNPNTGSLYLKSGADYHGVVHINIYNSMGQLVYTELWAEYEPNNVKQINIGSLSEGFYFVQVHSDNIKQEKKLILTK